MTNVVELERFLSWDGLAEFLGGCSKSYLEKRVREGMPSRIVAGKRAFKLSEVVPWLEEHGFIGERE